MSSPHVLLVTHSKDDAMARIVGDAVAAKGGLPHRLNTDRFPESLRLVLRQRPGGPARRFALSGEGGEIDLDSIEGVWYRRVASPALLDVDETYREICRKESRTVLMSLFASLRGARWIDPIPRVHLAHHKVLQLEVARSIGLATPDTLTTNDPRAVQDFFDEHGGRIVTKMMHSFQIDGPEGEQAFYTKPVGEDDLARLGGLRFCPMVFQEYVAKDVELRISAVGDRLFAASIDSQTSEVGKHDWRLDGLGLAGKFQPYVLPQDVESGLRALMRAYGLVYGAIDMIRTPDGRHVFLEINSAGEWGWLQMQVGLPIADALADVLVGRVPVDRPAPTLF